MEKKRNLLGIILLSLAVLIWGSSFIVQSVCTENVRFFTFNGLRSFIGGLALIPVALIGAKARQKRLTGDELAADRQKSRAGIGYGIILGVFLFIAHNCQQAAFDYSTAGKIAFITASYMFIVPILGLIFLKKRLPWITWVCVALGFVGMFFLCVDPSELAEINKGDLLTMVCALFYAVHILLIERFLRKADALVMSCVQMLTAGVLSGTLMLLVDKPAVASIMAVLPEILFSGIVVCGAAYTLQVVAQNFTEATVASLIMCLESVVAAVLGAIILKERMLPRELLGAVIMLAAAVVSQLTQDKKA